jgi:hypothetical protein
MPRTKGAPARRVPGSSTDATTSAATATAPANDTTGARSTTATSGTPITLRIRHAGGMTRLATTGPTETIAQLKDRISLLDAVLADPAKMLLYLDGASANANAVTTELADTDTVASANLRHGDIVRMRLSKPRPAASAAAAAAAATGDALRDKQGDKRKAETRAHEAAAQTKKTKRPPRQTATTLASGWSADDTATQLIHAAGSSSAHGARSADQFAQAHRIEAADKRQVAVNELHGSSGQSEIIFTNRNRDAEKFAPLDLPGLAAVVAAVVRKVRTNRRSNHGTARKHLEVASLAGTSPAIFWSVWLQVHTEEGAGEGAVDPASPVTHRMQALVDQLVAEELAAQPPSDMPPGMNV